MKVVVIGATGYVGGRLVPRLVERDYEVVCLVRDKKKAVSRSWAKNTTIIQGDVFDFDSLAGAFDGCDTIYYLVHSMAASSESFEELDRRAAENTARAASEASAKQIIYLGGLGKAGTGLSPHLRSRHEVGEILRKGSTPVTELRAAVIVGSGSLSFELIHHLVNKLPVMICPRWVYTKTQPIGIRDMLYYLVEAAGNKKAMGKIIDIGGPDVMTYGEMMHSTARALNLRRYLIPVPLLTPRLSSYWVNLVTPIQTGTARALIESLRHETICERDNAGEIFDYQPASFSRSVKRALGKISSHEIETSWTDAATSMKPIQVDESHLLVDKRELTVSSPPSAAFNVISSIGGNTGWYFADWLWKLRGFIDKQLGGVGLRRGRRHPTRLIIGDALDFWRVVDFEQDRKLLLHSEMNVWGEAWLEFEVQRLSETTCRLTQTAKYYPRGLWGVIYWYSIYPIHVCVFRGMIKRIAQRASDRNA